MYTRIYVCIYIFYISFALGGESSQLSVAFVVHFLVSSLGIWKFNVWTEERCVAVSCSVLQCVAACCSVLQRVAACCSMLQGVEGCCRVLQDVARCCGVLQCGAVCCSVLQCVAACCSVLQRVSACCSVKISLAYIQKRGTISHFCACVRVLALLMCDSYV